MPHAVPANGRGIRNAAWPTCGLPWLCLSFPPSGHEPRWFSAAAPVSRMDTPIPTPRSYDEIGGLVRPQHWMTSYHSCGLISEAQSLWRHSKSQGQEIRPCSFLAGGNISSHSSSLSTQTLPQANHEWVFRKGWREGRLRKIQRRQGKTITALKEASMPQRARGCCDWLERNSQGDVDPVGEKPGWLNPGFRNGIKCGSSQRKSWRVPKVWDKPRDIVQRRCFGIYSSGREQLLEREISFLKTTSVLWVEGTERFSFTTEKASFQQLPYSKTWEVEEKTGEDTWLLAHPWVLDKLKGALFWHLVGWLGGGSLAET